MNVDKLAGIAKMERKRQRADRLAAATIAKAEQKKRRKGQFAAATAALPLDSSDEPPRSPNTSSSVSLGDRTTGVEPAL
jgi:hypothetical protein